MHGVTSGWFNGADPVDLLEINKVICYSNSFTDTEYSNLRFSYSIRTSIVSSLNWQRATFSKAVSTNIY